MIDLPASVNVRCRPLSGVAALWVSACLLACGASSSGAKDPAANGGAAVGGALNATGGSLNGTSGMGAAARAGAPSGGATQAGNAAAGAAVGGSEAGGPGGARAGNTGTGGAGTGGAGSGGASSGGASSGAAGAPTSGAMALIKNDRFWTDTSGTPIYSQGGGVLKVADTYYWYGVKYQGAVTYAAAPTKSNSDTTFVAVTAYSSKDLVNWKFEHNVLVADSTTGSWFGRLGVVHNATSKKYVLVAQGGGGEYFATSDTPTGDFKFDHVQTNLPGIVNGTTGDQTTFQDDDGTAYVICSSSNGRANLYVAPLRPADSLAVEAGTRIFSGAGREGNALFKYNAHYYFCSSDLHGWNASHTYCVSASNINGPYGAEFVLDGTDADFSHVTQTGFFITVNGSKQSTVIFAGDRWSDFAGNGLGFNQWLPLTFTGTTPHFQSLSEWSLDAATGQWAVGAGNNYLRNPSFEADRVAISEPAGWTTTSTPTGSHSNATSGHTGRWYWKLGNTADYAASIEQTVTGLPSGSYTLSAWVKSSGGQASADLYAADGSAAPKTASLTAATSAWQAVTLPNIAISSGSARIGVSTKASASQSLSIDDLTFVKQ